MNRNERDYQDALNSLKFSDEAKERMMKHLMKQEEQAPAKRRGFHPLRTGLIAAAVCAALLGTAGAANVIARQARVNYFDSLDEYVEAQQAKSEADGVSGLILFQEVMDMSDYGELAPMDMDFWWNGEWGDARTEEFVVMGDGGDASGFLVGEGTIRYDDQPGQTLLEETAGTAGDGWTARRLFQHEQNGQTCLTSKYRAAALSGFDGLWDGWDTAWLEEHYTSVSERAMFEHVEMDGEFFRFLTAGEFRGQGDTVFNMQYSWNSGMDWKEENLLTANLDHSEFYTTADGVNVAIQTTTSHTGKTLFWANFYSGHGNFSMFGTQVELDELHTILDSLNLSALLEYVPAE